MQCAIKTNLTCVHIGSTASGDKTIFIKIHQRYLRLLIIAMCLRHCLNLICIKVPGSRTAHNGYRHEQNQREPATCGSAWHLCFLFQACFWKGRKQWWHLNASDHRARGKRPMVFYYNMPIQCSQSAPGYSTTIHSSALQNVIIIEFLMWLRRENEYTGRVSKTKQLRSDFYRLCSY